MWIPYTFIVNPCDWMDVLKGKLDFKAKLDILKTKTSQNFEEGFYYSSQGNSNGDFSYNPYTGNAGQQYADFNIPGGEKIDGFVHTHFAGGLSIFSPADLIAYYEIYQDGKVRDVDTYGMQVITNQGTVYSLMIDDLAKFQSFGSTALADQSLLSSTFLFLGLTPTSSAGDSERSFLKVLGANGGSGLKLFRGDASNLNNWVPITLDSNDNLIDDDCN